MSKWDADFTNDPLNDFEIVVEILHNDEDVAIIRRGEGGLQLKWYAHKEDLVVPLDWLEQIVIESKKQFAGK